MPHFGRTNPISLMISIEVSPSHHHHPASMTNHAILRSWSSWLSDRPHKFAQTGGRAESVRNEGRLRLELHAFGTPQKDKAVGHAGTNGFALVYPIWVIGLSHRIHPTGRRGIFFDPIPKASRPRGCLQTISTSRADTLGGVCSSGNALPQSSEFALISRR
jgi:hypothetical protein